MLLILSTSFDESAGWLYESVKARVPEIRWITADEIGASSRWEHRVNSHGAAVAFTLPSGERICSTRVRGVLNRLTYAPADPAYRPVAGDLMYVMQERAAFALSWLSSFTAPVWNRPDPAGLCGRWRHASEWVAMAAACGLPIRSYRQGDLMEGMDFAVQGRVTPVSTNLESVVVVNGVVTGANVPEKIKRSCRQMAELSNTTILGVDLFPGRLEFAGATPYPDLRRGGEELVDAFLAIAGQAMEATR